MNISRSNVRSAIGIIVLCVSAWNAIAADNSYSASVYSNIEFSMPKVIEPTFPDYTVSVTDFGAIPDGKTVNTKAINDAISSVAQKGGGKVVIPRGIWYTGPIIMKSNINLHAEAGALVIFSADTNDYHIVETVFEGLNTFRLVSPIYAYNIENIAITGEGIFDGTGEKWRAVKKFKVTENQWKAFVASGGYVEENRTWYPYKVVYQGSKISIMNVPKLATKEEHEHYKGFLRPVMVSIYKCKKVLLDGPTFQNSPAWNIHPLMSENLTFRNLTIRNPWYSQNGDGLDLESCKNTIIYNCTFDVGDDAICFKAGKDKQGRDRAMPIENAIIKNCIVYHGHGGFVVGSEMSSGVKNVHVSNCTFIGTDVGLRFKSARGRGGVVENIWISDIDMMNIPNDAIHFNLYYEGKAPSEDNKNTIDSLTLEPTTPVVTVETPVFRNFSIKNIVCKGAKRAIMLQGLPEMNLQNVTIDNIDIVSDNGIECTDVDNIRFTNINITPTKGPVFYLKNAKNLSIDKVKYTCANPDILKIKGNMSKNIQLSNKDFALSTISIDSTVNKSEVKIKGLK